MIISLISTLVFSVSSFNYKLNDNSNYNLQTPCEIIEKRTPFSSTFLYETNKYKTFCFNHPVNFYVDNHFERVDTNFVLRNDIYETKANSVTVYFDKKTVSVNNDIDFSLNNDGFDFVVKDNKIECDNYLIISYSDGLLYEKTLFPSSNYYSKTVTLTLNSNFYVSCTQNSFNFSKGTKNVYKLSSPFLSNGVNGLIEPLSVYYSLIGRELTIVYFFELEKNNLYHEFQEFFYLNRDSNLYSIEDKYFEVGYSTCYNSSVLMVGKSPLIGFGGQKPEYRAVFKIGNFLDYTYYNLTNAELIVRKDSGSLNVIEYYSARGSNYNNINGTSNDSLTYLGYSSLNTNEFSFDIKSELNYSHLNNQTYTNIILVGSENNKIANLYSSSSLVQTAYCVLTYNNFGNAADFVLSLDPLDLTANCLGYVLYQNEAIYIDSSLSLYFSGQIGYLEMLGAFYSCVEPVCNSKGYSCRVLSSQSTLIYSYERRIAFRVRLNASQQYYNDYHFVCQASDGSWISKPGAGMIPNQYQSLDDAFGSRYSSATVLIAISVL